MPPPPSVTYERLRDTIAKRMRMSPIDQPLMLMELLGHVVAWQEAARPRRRMWPGGARETDGGQGSPSTASPALATVPPP
jgi:hypothetical protein